MGRTYAGVLGYLAAALTLARGVIAQAGVEGTLMSAVALMATFAVIGFVLGSVAQATIDQAVGQRLAAQLDANPTIEAS
jgi:hypothetical protein